MFEARRRDDKYDLRLFPLWKVLNFHRLRRAARTKSKYDLCRQLVEKIKIRRLKSSAHLSRQKPVFFVNTT